MAGVAMAFCGFGTSPVQAASLGFLGGFGIFAQSNKAGGLSGESPGAFKIALDMPSNKYLGVGVEYLRSLGLGPFVSSGIGVAHILVRWYPFFPMPASGSDAVNDIVSYSNSGLAFWVAPAVGIAQGSTTDRSNIGLSVSPTAGVDWSWGSRFFMRSEGAFTMSFGRGKIMAITFLVGGVYRF
jgi:hypothetical protein